MIPYIYVYLCYSNCKCRDWGACHLRLQPCIFSIHVIICYTTCSRCTPAARLLGLQPPAQGVPGGLQEGVARLALAPAAHDAEEVGVGAGRHVVAGARDAAVKLVEDAVVLVQVAQLRWVPHL